MKSTECAAFGEFAKGRRVLFITTKNLDYIRNNQEINALKAAAKSLTVLGYAKGGYVSRLIRIYARLLFMPLKQFDAVFVGFAPQLILPFFGWRFKKKAVGEDFFISMYDTMVCDRKKFKSGSLPAKLLHKIDRRTLRGAELIIADTRAHGDYFVSEFGANAQKLKVAYLEADKSIYYPRDKKDGSKEFTVLYFGSVLPLQGTGVIIDCIRLMKDCAGIAFDIIGPVDEAARKSCEGCNVRFTSWLAQTELAGRIAQADLCLAGHFSADIMKASRTIPGKAYIYEAMQKPMILGDNSANHELFDENDGPYYFVKMGDAQALKDKILYAAGRMGFGVAQ